jgi:hypothetical protein
MSILREMHDKSFFDTPREFSELQRMISEAIERGYVEEVPVMIVRAYPWTEHWYKAKETGEIYSLMPPEFPAKACGKGLT